MNWTALFKQPTLFFQNLFSSPSERSPSPGPHLTINLDPHRPTGTLAQPAPEPPAEAPKEAQPMTIFEKLKGFEHNVTNWIASTWAKVYNDAPKVEQVADTFFKYAIPAVGIALDATGNAEISMPAIAALSEAQKDLHAASALVYDFGANPQAKTIVNTVASNLSGILTDAHIKNPRSVAAVTNVVSGALALAALLPDPAPAAPAPAQ